MEETNTNEELLKLMKMLDSSNISYSLKTSRLFANKSSIMIEHYELFYPNNKIPILRVSGGMQDLNRDKKRPLNISYIDTGHIAWDIPANKIYDIIFDYEEKRKSLEVEQ